LILVVKLKRTVGDLRVHGGNEENCVVTNGMLLGLRRERKSHPDTERRDGFTFGVE